MYVLFCCTHDRLEKLRKQSSNWRLSGIPTAEVKRPIFVRSQSHFAKTLQNVSDSNITIGQVMMEENAEEEAEMNFGKKRALLVGDSSGSEDEEKGETLIETLRITDDDDNEEEEQSEGSCDAESAKMDQGHSCSSSSGAVTSSSDSEAMPDLSPLLPRSSRLSPDDHPFTKKKLRRIASNYPRTEPFSPNSPSTSTSLSLPQSLMKTSISDSVMLNELLNQSEDKGDLEHIITHSCLDDGSTSVATGDESDPLPDANRLQKMHDRHDTNISLSHVDIQLLPEDDEENVSTNQIEAATFNGKSGSSGNYKSHHCRASSLGLNIRSGSDDRVRKVTVLEPPSIEDLYDAHVKEYAEVSRSLESLKEACDDLGRGPVTAESADFLLKQVGGEVATFVPKSLSLQSLSSTSVDGSLESNSSSSFTSSHSDASSQPGCLTSVISPNANIQTPNDNAFEDGDVMIADDESSHRTTRLRSNSIDDVFAELDDSSSDHVTPQRRRRLSSDCTIRNSTVTMTSSLETNQQDLNDDKQSLTSNVERYRKESYGPVRRRSRRKASLVLRLAQLNTEGRTFNSDDHLFKYKFVSLRYNSEYESLPALRTLLILRPRNTEGQNYKLSYEREK